MSRQPKTTAAATRLLERYAELEGQLSIVEAVRSADLAAANAKADAEAAPLIQERDSLTSALEPWFREAGQVLLPKGRKSMELGGCMVGSRAGRASLHIAGEEKDVVAVLSGLRWAKPLLRIKTTLDRSATMRSVDGKHGLALAELGITRQDGEETFFIERVEQGGTVGTAQ